MSDDKYLAALQTYWKRHKALPAMANSRRMAVVNGGLAHEPPFSK